MEPRPSESKKAKKCYVYRSLRCWVDLVWFDLVWFDWMWFGLSRSFREEVACVSLVSCVWYWYLLFLVLICACIHRLLMSVLVNVLLCVSMFLFVLMIWVCIFVCVNSYSRMNEKKTRMKRPTRPLSRRYTAIHEPPSPPLPSPPLSSLAYSPLPLTPPSRAVYVICEQGPPRDEGAATDGHGGRGHRA